MKISNYAFSLAMLSLSVIGFAQNSETQYLLVDPVASSVIWTGSKVIGGSHTGTVDLASGKLAVTGDAITSGSFAVNMSSLQITDLTGATAEKLSGHLFSQDFFDVEEHPSASFNLKSSVAQAANTYLMSGDLRIKDQTHPISFPAELSRDAAGNLVATAQIAVDRTKYGVRYGSDSFFDNLGDKAIKDEFTLDIKLVAK